MENKYTRDQIKDAIWQELKESDYAGENNDIAYEVIGIVMAGVDKIVGESGQTKEVNKISVTDIASTLEYYQGVIAGLADKEDDDFSRSVHNQRIGMLHEAIETIARYKQYLQEAPLTQSRADLIREANNRDLVAVAAPTVIEYGVEKFEGWYAWFRIGVQKFRLQDATDKEHAEWYVKMLKIAFTNLGGTAAGREEDAVTFAKWATQNHWRWVTGLQVWKNPMQDIDQMTTAELYAIFKQLNINNENS